MSGIALLSDSVVTLEDTLKMGVSLLRTFGCKRPMYSWNILNVLFVCGNLSAEYQGFCQTPKKSSIFPKKKTG